MLEDSEYVDFSPTEEFDAGDSAAGLLGVALLAERQQILSGTKTEPHAAANSLAFGR